MPCTIINQNCTVRITWTSAWFNSRFWRYVYGADTWWYFSYFYLYQLIPWAAFMSLSGRFYVSFCWLYYSLIYDLTSHMNYYVYLAWDILPLCAHKNQHLSFGVFRCIRHKWSLWVVRTLAFDPSNMWFCTDSADCTIKVLIFKIIQYEWIPFWSVEAGHI